MFGSRILGTKKFDEQQEKKRKSANIYGHRVSGMGTRVQESGSIESPTSVKTPVPTPEQELEAERELLAEKRRELEKLGVKVIDGKAVLATPEADDNGDGYLSEAEVKDALVKQPELYQRLVDLELVRGKGPRKGVSRLLLEFEQNTREGGPRADVIARLTHVIEG
jgi:hypothetical protein